MELSKNFNSRDPKKVARRIKIFNEHTKNKDSINYDKIYNEMNYVSPAGHLKRYLPQCFKHVSKGDKWLEVGCGSCRDGLKYVQKNGIDVYGFDIVDESVEIAHKLDLKNIIKHSASEPFPYDSDYFDFVSCVDVLEHLTLEDANDAISEINRVLKPNKYALLASCPTQAFDHVHLTIQSNDEWIKLYSVYGLKFIKKMFNYGVLVQKS